jgi:hypothetical protein
MHVRAIAFLITILIGICALIASFNAKPPKGQYLIDAGPGVWPEKAESQVGYSIVCRPEPFTDIKGERSKKVQHT